MNIINTNMRTIMDINSPEFSAVLYELIQKAQHDSCLRKKLLAQPKKVLAEHGLNLSDYQVHLEENQGYNLYFEISHQDILHKPSIEEGDNPSEQDSFIDHHYMDCHNV